MVCWARCKHQYQQEKILPVLLSPMKYISAFSFAKNKISKLFPLQIE